MNLYFCQNCRVKISAFEDSLIIDSNNKNLFCSEACIEEFYRPLIAYFTQYERDQISALGIREDNKEYNNDLQECMANPNEIYCLKNEVEESFYFAHYLNPSNNVYTILGLLVYQGRPSFIFFNSCTKIKELADKFKIGEKIQFSMPSTIPPGSDENPSSDIEGVQDSFDDENSLESETSEQELSQKEVEFEKFIELKKSQELADLINSFEVEGFGHDIGIENFHLYEKCLHPTLESPDEVYEFKDRDGDNLFIYIKVFNEKKLSYFYIAMVHLFDTDADKDQDVLIPILSFPTINAELYRSYQRGERIIGATKN